MTGRDIYMTQNKLLQTQRWLYRLNGVIWISLGISTLFRGSSGPASAGTMLVIGVMMFGNAAAFLYLGWRIVHLKVFDLIAAALVLGVNILLTFTDQMGFLDWATLVMDLVLAGLLVVTFFRRRAL
jgi:hypothetical protein